MCREYNHFFYSVFTNLGVVLCKIIADSIKVALGIGNWALSTWCDQQTIASQCQFQMSKPTFIESAISMWIIFYETEKQSLIIIMTIITSTAQSFKRKNIILNDSPSIDNFWIPHSICPPPPPPPNKFAWVIVFKCYWENAVLPGAPIYAKFVGKQGCY